ncbi:TonB-dependent receptor plug domain-containing protein, partial [Sphingosinicella sp. YJ22]|uniref:TonB-dependent receptor plug domain-containing protein n=1 Tax=Sphingosinicella sp. YJ22 TaxID=1104780 RepID=UPI0014074826
MIGRLAMLSLLAVPAPAFAQGLPAGEDVVVVTGRGLDEAAGEAVYGIVAIGRDRLASSPSNRLEDVLRDVPGFQLFRRSDARSANPTSQGATLRALGGNASSRALLILDGVPQTDPFGGWISWPAYHPRRLGQVRVVRGGGSGAAGPGALAGTIELDSAGPGDLRG